MIDYKREFPKLTELEIHECRQKARSHLEFLQFGTIPTPTLMREIFKQCTKLTREKRTT